MDRFQTLTLFRNWTIGLLLAFWMVGAAPLLAQETADPAVSTLPSAEQVTTSLDDLLIMLVPLTGSDLAELATVWQGHLKSALTETSELNLSLKNLDDTQAAQVRKQLAENVSARKSIEANYDAVLSGWEAKGATPEELQPHKTYIAALTVAAVQTIDAKTAVLFVADWMTSWDGGLGVVLKLFVLAVAIWILMIVARILKRTSARGLERVPNLSKLLKSFIVVCVYWMTFVLGILLVLGLFGVNVTPLFAVFGGLSFILGFALQDTLGNLASGLMIMILKPYDTGDYIQVSGTAGFVDEMSVVSTRIRTVDNQIIVVPNSKIWGDVITNVSASEERRVDLVFGIGYSDDTQLAIRVLNDLVDAHPKCLKEPASEIFVGELGDSSVNIFCRPWSKSGDYWAVYWELTGQAKERFDQEGISIPFPQRDVHIIHDDAPARLPEAAAERA